LNCRVELWTHEPHPTSNIVVCPQMPLAYL
jgi:hypothetical protein